MVNFSSLPCKLFKVPPELREQFQGIGLLLRWDYTDTSRTYTGLAIADVTIDVETNPIPMNKVQEMSKIVQTEFAQHIISKYRKPGNA
jgi:hypothetical protein